jgi:hypothetical protein
MEQRLARIVAEFESNRMAYGKALRQMLEMDRQAFFEAALPILRSPQDSQGIQYLLTLLLNQDMILQHISDPDLFSFDQALMVARRLIRIEPLLDIKMIRGLMDGKDSNSRLNFEQQAGSARGTRLLELIAEISDGARILPVMAQLLQHPNAWVRSKAALVVGRSNKNHRWVEQVLAESDGRVRANAVESLWGDESEGARQVFWVAVTDADNRVAGNAVLGLYRLGDAASIALLLDMSKHASSEFRVTAIWAMGETGDPRFLSVLAKALSDSDAKVRTAAFRAVAKLKQSSLKYAAGPPIHIDVQELERTATSACMTIAAWTDGENSVAKEVSGLRPTQFVMLEKGQLIGNYEIRETSHPEALNAAFVMPRMTDASDPFQTACERAFAQAMRHKRKSDAWLAVKFFERDREATLAVGARAEGTPGSILGLSATGPPIKVEVAPAQFEGLPENTRFSSDPAAIRAAVEAAGSRAGLPRSLGEATRALLPMTGQCRGPRHIVLLLDVGNSEGSHWADVIAQARKSKIAVHTVALKDAPVLAEVCSRTGGFYRRIASSSELPRTVEGLYASMVNQFQIRYTPPESEAPPASIAVKLQIYSGNSFGECHSLGRAQTDIATEVARAG